MKNANPYLDREPRSARVFPNGGNGKSLPNQLLNLVLVMLIGLHIPAQDTQWQDLNVGIPCEIGIAALAIAPSDPNVLYISTATAGGVYVSTDGGFGWANMADGLSQIGVLSLVVHPKDPYSVYAGTANGLYRTSRLGQSDRRRSQTESVTWERVYGLNVSYVYAVLLTPGPMSQIYVGSEEGLFWSENDGQDWCQVQAVNHPVLCLDATQEGDIYAGTAGQGLIVSQDSGQTWHEIEGPLAQSTVMAIQVTQDKELYCWSSEGLLVFKLGDQFQLTTAYPSGPEINWHPVHLPDGREIFGFGLGESAGQPSAQRNAKRLYVGSRGKGIWVSEDPDSPAPGWHRTGAMLDHAEITCLEVHPDDSRIAFAGTKFNGLYRTDDSGQNWQLVSEEVGPRTIMALARNPVHSAEIYAGTVGGLYRTNDSGRSWKLSTGELGKLIVQGIAIDSVQPEHVYIATHVGAFRSEDSGHSWEWSTEPLGKIHLFNIMASRSPCRGEITTLYAGSWGNNVLRSLDSGHSWAPIHNGLETLSVHAFAQHPDDPYTLFAGTVEEIYRSDDGGTSWVITNQGMRPGITTFAFAFDKQRPERLYAGTTAGIYRSESKGDQWTLITDETLNVTINALAVHPTQTAVLVAGTEHHGLHLSTDAGEHWSPLGFDGTSVYAVLIDAQGLWVGTEKGIFAKELKVKAQAE